MNTLSTGALTWSDLDMLSAELPSAAPAPPPAVGCTARYAPSSSSPSESLLTVPPPGIPPDDGSVQKLHLLDVNGYFPLIINTKHSRISSYT